MTASQMENYIAQKASLAGLISLPVENAETHDALVILVCPQDRSCAAAVTVSGIEQLRMRLFSEIENLLDSRFDVAVRTLGLAVSANG